MPVDQTILAIAMPFMLVLFRLTGLFLFAPLLSGRTVPRRFRVLIAAMLAIATTPLVLGRGEFTQTLSIYDLPFAILSELLIGAILGWIAMVPIFAMDMAGVIMGHQMGFGLARVYNPDLNTDTDALGQLLMLFGTAIFLAVGGLEILFVCIINSFEHIPPGGFVLTGELMQSLTGVLASGVELALRVAAPVVVVIALLMVLLALLMKTMPQINIMTVGFTIKIIAAMAAVAGAIPAMHEAVENHFLQTGRLMIDWASVPQTTPRHHETATPSSEGF